MSKIKIEGGYKLTGEIEVSGAKNSAVALVPAAILCDEEVTISNVPNISDIDSLEEINPDIILINPNFTVNSNITMPVTRRLEIIKWAKENNVLIIEDDYNGELRYSTHPMPCVQNYDTENTVYLGSFSKILLPSVRISYMVLPQKLTDEYNKIKKIHKSDSVKNRTNCPCKVY